MSGLPAEPKAERAPSLMKWCKRESSQRATSGRLNVERGGDVVYMVLPVRASAQQRSDTATLSSFNVLTIEPGTIDDHRESCLERVRTGLRRRRYRVCNSGESGALFNERRASTASLAYLARAPTVK